MAIILANPDIRNMRHVAARIRLDVEIRSKSHKGQDGV